MKKFGFAIVGIVLLAVAVLGYFLLRAPQVEVVRGIQGSAVEAVYAAGTVEATVMFPISSRLVARIAEVLVEEGQQVEAGQMLLRFDDEEILKTVAELEARLAFAEKEFERQKKLLANRVSSAESYERAEADVEALRSSLGAAKARLEYLYLRAPSAGTVIKRDAEVGQLVTVNQDVFWFADEGPLRVTAEVDEEDIGLIEVGQRVVMRADAFPGQLYEGAVASITPKGDPVARSYRVRISFNKESSTSGTSAAVPLKIGMTVENNIIVRKVENAFLIPRSSVVQEYVWLVRDGELQKRAVELGVRGDDRIEVRSGLGSSDDIVRTPQSDFVEGQRLRAILVEWNSDKRNS